MERAQRGKTIYPVDTSYSPCSSASLPLPSVHSNLVLATHLVLLPAPFLPVFFHFSFKPFTPTRYSQPQSLVLHNAL